MNPVAIYTDVLWLPTGSTLEVFLDDQELPDDICTTAFVFGMNETHEFLMAHVLKRGVDVPGGHIEAGETPYVAAIREFREETGGSVEKLTKIGHFKLTVPNPPDGYKYPTPVAYCVFFYGAVTKIEEVTVPEECGTPRYMSLGEINDIDKLHRHFPLFNKAYRLNQLR